MPIVGSNGCAIRRASGRGSRRSQGESRENAAARCGATGTCSKRESPERAGLEAGPSLVSERSEQLDALLRQLATLPERERLAVHAHYFHDQRADDAAAAIGVSRSGYYALLNRALDKAAAAARVARSPHGWRPAMNETQSDSMADDLAVLHAEVNERHGASRERLLAALPQEEVSVVRSSSVWPRWAIGGACVSAVCGLVAVAMLLASPRPIVAMERMARALERVSSYSWKMESVYVSTKGEGRTLQDTNGGRWRREPRALHATTHVTETKGTNTPIPAEPRVVVNLEETRGPKWGVVIDHLRKTYWWTPGLTGVSSPGGSPQAVIFKVKSRRGRVLRDLGERVIEGRVERGVEIRLDGGDPETETGPATPESPEGQTLGWDWRNVTVEAWYDPATDLPIEFSMTRRGDDDETTYRYTDLEWNVDFDETAFQLARPETYDEVDAPDLN